MVGRLPVLGPSEYCFKAELGRLSENAAGVDPAAIEEGKAVQAQIATIIRDAATPAAVLLYRRGAGCEVVVCTGEANHAAVKASLVAAGHVLGRDVSVTHMVIGAALSEPISTKG